MPRDRCPGLRRAHDTRGGAGQRRCRGRGARGARLRAPWRDRPAPRPTDLDFRGASCRRPDSAAGQNPDRDRGPGPPRASTQTADVPLDEHRHAHEHDLAQGPPRELLERVAEGQVRQIAFEERVKGPDGRLGVDRLEHGLEGCRRCGREAGSGRRFSLGDDDGERAERCAGRGDRGQSCPPGSGPRSAARPSVHPHPRRESVRTEPSEEGLPDDDRRRCAGRRFTRLVGEIGGPGRVRRGRRCRVARRMAPRRSCALAAAA